MLRMTPAHDGLIRAIRDVRRRHALRLLLRGIALCGLATLLAIFVSAKGLDAFRYSRGAVLAFRGVAWTAIAVTLYRFVVTPLWAHWRRRISDLDIARYIEEHEPSLDAALRSAVDSAPGVRSPQELSSGALRARLIDDVELRLQALDVAKTIERPKLRLWGSLASALGAALIGAGLFSPVFVRQALPYLFAPFSTSARAASPYSIEVDPRGVTIARGGDQEIVARLRGFGAEKVELVTRAEGATEWKRSEMFAHDAGVSGGDEATRGAMLIAVNEKTEYFVEAAGMRSDVFRIDVQDRPYVKNIDLLYRFPSYTGMAPKKVEGGGDIAALRGTDIDLVVTPTFSVKAGRLVIEGRDTIALKLDPAKGTALMGSFRVAAQGFYKVELSADGTNFVEASPSYLIDVLKDLPPVISFTKPGHDSQVTTIEEVFTEVKAEDDYGVAQVELRYSVNGAEEKSVSLHSSPALKQLSAGHTFFLEEMSLKPGDFISYYARAHDLGSGQTASTDIFFMEARPFRRDFKQAEQAGGGGGGGGDQQGSLSQQQRQVIAATFRLNREKEDDAKKRAQDIQTVALIQGRLRGEVEQLRNRMASRGVLTEGSEMHGTAEELRQAIDQMKSAEAELGGSRVSTALPPEQKALAHLQRAEAEFRDAQVSFGGGGGGGGGGNNSSAEELADLFELELDKLRNQYETLQSGAQERRDEEVDEAMSRLQELARRQEQENERLRQRGMRAPNQGGGGGASQRQLADEAEELGRKLEKLTREKSSSGLEESARRLREAAQEMRRQAAQARGGGQPSSSSSSDGGQQALDALREAKRLLGRDQEQRLDRDLREAREKAAELREQQGRIANDLREMQQSASGESGTSTGSRSTESNRSKAARVQERKDALASEIASLESSLDRMSRESRRDEKEASRKMQEAANGIRDSKLKEKVRYTKGLVDRNPQASEPFERDIEAQLEALGERLKDAEGVLGGGSGGEEKKKSAALDRARDLARGLDSLGERLKARGDKSASKDGANGAKERGTKAGEGLDGAKGDEPGQSGQDGQRGDPSQSGGDGKREGERSASQGQGQQPGGTGGGMRGSAVQGGVPGGGGGTPGMNLSAEEVRQLRRELRERSGDAEALRRALEEGGVSSQDARSLVQRLESLASGRNFKDPRGIAELTAQIADDVKMLEYVLRREIEGTKPRLQLSGSDDLPPGYKSLVEEYYRALSRSKER